MKKRKIISKIQSLDFIGDYFWVMGLGVFSIGISLLYPNPLALMIIGFIALVVAAILKGIRDSLKRALKE